MSIKYTSQRENSKTIGLCFKYYISSIIHQLHQHRSARIIVTIYRQGVMSLGVGGGSDEKGGDEQGDEEEDEEDDVRLYFQ